jgi:hypothetical protein
MLTLYKELLGLAARRAARSWLAALSIPIFVVLVMLVGLLVARLPGILAGIILGLSAAACFGSYLSLVAMAIDGSKIRLVDLKDGLRSVWDLCGIFVVLMFIGMIVGMFQKAAGPNGEAVGGIATLAAAILLNALPEVIYQRRAGYFAALQESATFVFENPVAWFVPNLLFAFFILAATGSLAAGSPGELLMRLARLGSVDGVLQFIGAAPGWMAPFLIAFVHFAMVFRGLLFRELSGGSSRMRAFRRRMEG